MRLSITAMLGAVLLSSLAKAESESPSFQPSGPLLDEVLNGNTVFPQLDLNPFDASAGSGWTTKQFYISGTVGDPAGPIITAHAGAGYEFLEDVTVNLELLSGFVDNNVSNKSAAVFGLDLLFRWHFLKGDHWTVYFDGGAGFELTTTDYPSDSFWTFRLMLGPGATFQLTENIQLMGGVRYIHISNAYTSPINNSLDAAQLYLGVMIPF